MVLPNSSIIQQNERLQYCIREAYSFYEKQEVKRTYNYYAVDILIRYLLSNETPRGNDRTVLYVAALYITKRHPFSYPNPSSRRNFSKKYHLKPSSLKWYVSRIVESLGFFKIYDSHSRPYFIDSKGIIYTLSSSVTAARVSSYFIRQVASNEKIDIELLADDILSELIDKMHLIPPIFRPELRRLILSIVKKDLENTRLKLRIRD